MMKRFASLLVCLFMLSAVLTGCMATAGKRKAKIPEMPEELTLDNEGVPLLTVYDIAAESYSQTDVETYLEGVLAGEMRNDWPEEALKAQAILARTFVMRFISTKDSQYDGADISTDVKEAQAYAPNLVNDRIKKAVLETRGLVVSYEGELANTWFHAHSGGMTELPVEGLEYKENPPYTKRASSSESEDAPESVKAWTASFSLKEVEKACQDAGVTTGSIQTVETGEKSESGRSVTLFVNGKPVSAPAFRIQIGADKLKSTLITDVSVKDGTVTFAGKGYGHGVGMSQWGAYQMAQEGKSAMDIIAHYFDGVDVVPMWAGEDEETGMDS